jgi:hypothetical protein
MKKIQLFKNLTLLGITRYYNKKLLCGVYNCKGLWLIFILPLFSRYNFWFDDVRFIYLFFQEQSLSIDIIKVHAFEYPNSTILF